ncbi:MAG: 50S ribosomal protein L23 [Gammaproteobacteria bacterium]
MKAERLLTVLLAPKETEKSTYIGEKYEQYVFKVMPDATRREVKKAVERLFSVKVNAVNLLNVKGKVRKRVNGTVSRQPSWKKAYVRLEKGSQIDFAR